MDEVEDCAGWMTAPGLTDSNTVIYIYIIYILYSPWQSSGCQVSSAEPENITYERGHHQNIAEETTLTIQGHVTTDPQILHNGHVSGVHQTGGYLP